VYVVIFRAEIARLDAEYEEMAARMRDLAISQYGCREFVISTEGNQELALSYWDNEDQIKVWRNNAEHLLAQSKGQNKWYSTYTVEVAEVVRSYSMDR